MTILPRPADWATRLDIAAPLAMAKLAELTKPVAADPRYPFRLITRRLNDAVNSCSHDNPVQLRKWPYNPAFMNPADLERLGVSNGDAVAIASAHGEIVGIAEADADVRPGCVSMPQSWGRHPDHPGDPRVDGANTGRLVSMDRDLDELTGQPLMSAVPVSVTSA